MDKENVIYRYIMKYNLAFKKKEILSFATWIKLEGSMLSEINQRQTVTTWCHLHVESKQKQKQKNGPQRNRE